MKTILKTTLGVATAALLASTAQAGEDKMVDADKTMTKTQTVRTIDADGQVGEITIFSADQDERKVAVLGAFSQQATEAYIVQDNEGDIFINHLVPVEALPDPNLDVEVIDTYEVTYRGMTFTNKVIAEQ